MDDIRDEYGGWHDPELATKGWVQAVELGQKLYKKGVQPDVVLTSPLKRAGKTAAALAEVLGGARVENFVYLKERNTYGLLCGLNKAEAKEKYPELVEAYEKGEAVPGYEPYDLLQKRVKAFLEIVAKRSEETVICVTHGKFLTALLKEELGHPVKGLTKSAVVEAELKNGQASLLSIEGEKE